MTLTVKQRGVLKGIMAGAAITIVVIMGAVCFGPKVLAPEASAGERLGFAIWSDAFIALWLAISIGLLAKHRFFTPEDIDGGGLSRGSEAASVLQSTLQNTLEQSVLAVLVHLAWSILMPVTWMWRYQPPSFSSCVAACCLCVAIGAVRPLERSGLLLPFTQPY